MTGRTRRAGPDLRQRIDSIEPELAAIGLAMLDRSTITDTLIPADFENDQLGQVWGMLQAHADSAADDMTAIGLAETIHGHGITPDTTAAVVLVADIVDATSVWDSGDAPLIHRLVRLSGARYR